MDSRLDIIEKDVTELKAGRQAIELRLVALDQWLTDELPHLATKVDLEKMRNEIRLWIIGSWITMFFSMAGLNLALYNLAKS
jgi:hypothetical protein